MIHVRLSDGRTIPVDTDDPKAAAEAGRRFLAYEDVDKRRPKQDFISTAADAMTLGLTRPVGAAAWAGLTGVSNAVTRAQGKKPAYGMGEAFNAARQVENDRAAQFSKEHPGQNVGGALLGGLAMPGGSLLAKFVGEGVPIAARAPQIVKAVAQGKSLLPIAARSAVAGAPIGAVAGANTADPGQEAEGMAKGAAFGAGAGALVPVGGAGLVKGYEGGSAAVRTVARAANKASGGKLLNPAQEAAKRFAASLKADGAKPEQIREVMNQWLKVGGPTPAMIDMAAKLPTGGQATLGLIRSAAMKAGPGRSAAVNYTNQVAADLQDNAISRTRALTGDKRPAGAVSDDLTKIRKETADRDYNPVYPVRIRPGDETTTILTDAPGKTVLRQARADALERRDMGRVAEIDDWLTASEHKPLDPMSRAARARQEGFDPDTPYYHGTRGDFTGDLEARPSGDYGPGVYVTQSQAQAHNYTRPGMSPGDTPNVRPVMVRPDAAEPAGSVAARVVRDPEDVRSAFDQFRPDNYVPAPEEISAAVLHRARVAMGERGDKLQRAGNRSRAGGSFSRAGIIDDALEQVPELAPANARYRDFSEQIEGIEHGQGGMNMPPDEFVAPFLERPGMEKTAPIGYRQALTDAIGRPTEGATGVLNRISTSTNQKRNLSTVFGPDDASDYRESIGNMVDQVNNARFINPNTGSQTAGRLFDEGLVDLPAPPTTKTGIIMALVNKVRQGSTLTPEERASLVSLGVGEPSAVLRLVEPYLRPARVGMPVSSRLAAPTAGYAGRQ